MSTYDVEWALECVSSEFDMLSKYVHPVKYATSRSGRRNLLMLEKVEVFAKGMIDLKGSQLAAVRAMGGWLKAIRIGLHLEGYQYFTYGDYEKLKRVQFYLKNMGRSA